MSNKKQRKTEKKLYRIDPCIASLKQSFPCIYRDSSDYSQYVIYHRHKLRLELLMEKSNED